MTSPSAWPEAEYRKCIQEIYHRIEGKLADVDPDIAECEQSLGAMTITFGDRTRCILSAQPSVRQLWLALAALGTAIHFNYDAARRVWMDDKGKGIELLSCLEKYLSDKMGMSIKLG